MLPVRNPTLRSKRSLIEVPHNIPAFTPVDLCLQDGHSELLRWVKYELGCKLDVSFASSQLKCCR